MLFKAFSQRLYLRIWLAVVGGVAVLTLIIGWAWQETEAHNARNNASPTAMAREMIITDSAGGVVVQGPFERIRPAEGEAPRFAIQGADGSVYFLEMSAAPRIGGRNAGPGSGRHAPPNNLAWAFWLHPPFGFLWLLAVVGVVVAVGVFPIIRRLLKRLENLQRGVKRFGEGDLTVRVPASGDDEVADLARQFNAAASRIEDLVQSHKSLLANASHELRSPLARIRMGLELMGDDSDPSIVKAKTEIQRNINELDQLVDEILLASRLESEAVDVGSMESVDLVGLAAEECARVDADLDVQATEALEVTAIAKLVRRAIRNLLENARRYSHGEISLHLSRECDMAVIRVEDIGPGVPANQRERIFEKFYRLPGASERSGGVGLGLSLVRSIALRHGGSVVCETRQDGQQGASFVLRLPIHAG